MFHQITLNIHSLNLHKGMTDKPDVANEISRSACCLSDSNCTETNWSKRCHQLQFAKSLIT